MGENIFLVKRYLVKENFEAKQLFGPKKIVG